MISYSPIARHTAYRGMQSFGRSGFCFVTSLIGCPTRQEYLSHSFRRGIGKNYCRGLKKEGDGMTVLFSNFLIAGTKDFWLQLFLPISSYTLHCPGIFHLKKTKYLLPSLHYY